MRSDRASPALPRPGISGGSPNRARLPALPIGRPSHRTCPDGDPHAHAARPRDQSGRMGQKASDRRSPSETPTNDRPRVGGSGPNRPNGVPQPDVPGMAPPGDQGQLGRTSAERCGAAWRVRRCRSCCCESRSPRSAVDSPRVDTVQGLCENGEDGFVVCV